MINFFSNQELRIILNSYVLDNNKNSALSFIEDNTDNRNNREETMKLMSTADNRQCAKTMKLMSTADNR